MAGNAHANRQRRHPSTKHRMDCIFCQHRPCEGLFRNANGHRHNPTAKHRGRRNETHVVHQPKKKR